MRPYYNHAWFTIHHGDALEVLDSGTIPAADVVLTDPPYASGSRTEASRVASGAMLRAGRFADRRLTQGSLDFGAQ